MTTRRLLAELRATPRPLGDIAEACNVSRREVELALEDARKAGRPIVANGRGIYLASSLADLIAYERSLQNRVRSQMVTVRGVRRAIREWSGQLSLFGEAA